MTTRQTICTNCEFKTTDGCGPGSVMICGHPHFKNAEAYDDAIIYWAGIWPERVAVSDECPKTPSEVYVMGGQHE